MDEAKPNGEEHKRKAELWLDRIRKAEKRDRFDAWMKDAEAAEKAYSGDADNSAHGKVYSFNILHSNIETIVPAIFNSTPAPDIRERHRKGEPVAKVVAEILERAIAIQIDDSKMDAEVEASAQDAFMAGRGVVRVRFDADVEELPPEMGLFMDPETGEEYEEETPPRTMVSNERVSYEVVAWRDYREGPGRRFEDLPWIAFRHFVPEEEMEKIADGEMVASQEAIEGTGEGDNEEDGDIPVWEIWCKESRTVKYVRETDSTLLAEREDPLEIEGFFPIAAPVQPIAVTARRTPVCPFTVYKDLADELDRLTVRINAIVKGLKVRGWIVANGEDVERLAEAQDNELVPIHGYETAAAIGGIEKSIVWWPVDKAIQVLRELYLAREQAKSAIYEVTGISDIVRGDSKASETATAQNIKSQWGSLRIKRMQRLIERQVRDLFVITAQIISSKFSPATLQQMTGIEITAEHVNLLQSPLQHYQINVESDSTIRADLSRMRGEMGEFLNGTATYFATMQPLIAAAPEAAGPVADMYASFARQFNLGKQGEDAVEQLAEMAKQQAQQPRPNPEAEAMQADMQAKQAEMQAKQQETAARMQLEAQKLSTDTEFKRADLSFRQAEAAQKIQIQRDQMAFEREKAALEMNMRQSETETQRMISGADGTLEKAIGEAIESVVATIQDGDARLSAQLASQTAALADGIREGNEAIAAAMLAPKKLVRDAQGRPVGVEAA